MLCARTCYTKSHSFNLIKHHSSLFSSSFKSHGSLVYSRNLNSSNIILNEKEPLLKVGDAAELEKCFDTKDVAQFSSLSEDRNPIHLNADYAASTRFNRPIVHGMLTSSLFSAILGTKLPGKGSIYISQSLSFKQPVFVGETIRARVEVMSLHETKPIVTFKTQCFNQKGELCVGGEAVVYVPHHAGRKK